MSERSIMWCRRDLRLRDNPALAEACAAGEVLAAFVLDPAFDASNNHGWQWAAGSGTDAAPYFRVFNPSAQQEKFDPAGEYGAAGSPSSAPRGTRPRWSTTRPNARRRSPATTPSGAPE